MKMLLTAIAMMIAAPALAQTPAPVDAHAGHADEAPAEDREMKGGCCDEMADGKPMPCCEKMDCCEKDDADTAADPHAGHDTDPE